MKDFDNFSDFARSECSKKLIRLQEIKSVLEHIDKDVLGALLCTINLDLLAQSVED